MHDGPPDTPLPHPEAPEPGRLRDLEGIVHGCLEGIEQEIEAVLAELDRRGIAQPVVGTGGRLRERPEPGFRYAWTLTVGPLDIRPEDGVWIRTPAGEALGFVASYDRRTGGILVRSPEWLGRAPGSAELEFDPTWLLRALARRLEEVLEEPERYYPRTALLLLGRIYPSLGRLAPRRPGGRELNAAQRDALSRILGSEVQFVWGPPGTGKTRLLGEAVAELAERGRVLVAAVTNGALDEAAARVVEALGEDAVRAGRVLRIGAEFRGTADPRLSLDAQVARRLGAGAGGIVAEVEQLERRLLRAYEPQLGVRELLRREDARTGSEAGGLVGFRNRLARLSTAARTVEDSAATAAVGRLAAALYRETAIALRDADVVLTTLAGLAVKEELRGERFQALVLDEASSAPLPHAILAACHVSGRAVAIGDFQQLPPVVVSDAPSARRWLSRDLFRESGIVKDADPGSVPLPAPGDRLCAVLVEQYRMAPPIRTLVSELFYGGKLEDAPSVRSRAGFPAPLVLLDTGPLDPRVERSDGSRANPVHLEIVLDLVEAARASGVEEIAVIVPYRLQARRLARAVGRRLGEAVPSGLEISTVHRYQGRETSVVIFDTVDAPPGRSWFLSESRNPDLPRLLNVALSRTRDCLIVVATVPGLRRTLPAAALLHRLLDHIREFGLTVRAPLRRQEMVHLLRSGGSGVRRG